ncbi:hypothetical protein ACWGJ2_27930 [Streptomyces sp. NPDC054796]
MRGGHEEHRARGTRGPYGDGHDDGYGDGQGDGYGPPYDGRGPRPGGPRRTRTGPGNRGVPDSLLVGGLAFLLGLTVFTWTATGLAGLFSHGSWPEGVTFGRTPLAIRALATEPHDLAGAWPDAPDGQLSGYGLFWGVFISQLLVLLVVTVFVVGTVARARAVRAARRDGLLVRPRRPHEQPPPAREAAETPVPTPTPAPAPAPPPVEQPQEPTPTQDATGTGAEAGTATGAGVGALMGTGTGIGSGIGSGIGMVAAPGADADPRTLVQDAPGAALVVTRDATLWEDTKDGRAKLGPVHVFDPTHLCDTPNRIRWAPHHNCADKTTAAARATALLEPLRSPRPIDAEAHAAAVTLLRCWLHAAALEDRPFREVHRWALAKTPPSDPVQTLRTHRKASPGSAGELEATLTAHPERRRAATELIRQALAPLAQLHVRNACTAARADRVALESFLDETGTLYVVGEDPEVMPILNALTQSVAEHGRRVSVRPSAARLDPPLTTVLAMDPSAPLHPPAP